MLPKGARRRAAGECGAIQAADSHLFLGLILPCFFKRSFVFHITVSYIDQKSVRDKAHKLYLLQG